MLYVRMSRRVCLCVCVRCFLLVFSDANAFAAWFVKYIHDTRCEFAKTKIKAQTTKKRSSLGGAVAAVAGAAMTAAAAVMGHRAAQTLPSRKK